MSVKCRRSTHGLGGIVDEDVERALGAIEVAREDLDARRVPEIEPVDLEAISDQALGAEKHFRPLPELRALESSRSSLILSVVTSLLFSAVLLAFASRRMARIDY